MATSRVCDCTTKGTRTGRIVNSAAKRRCIFRFYPLMTGAEVMGLPLAVGLLSVGRQLVSGAPVDYEGFTGLRRAYLKRLERLVPGVIVLWAETQERGAPHYHLVAIGLGPAQYEAASKAWVTLTEKSSVGFAPARYLPVGAPGAPRGLNAWSAGRALDLVSVYLVEEMTSGSKAVQKVGYQGKAVGRCWQ